INGFKASASIQQMNPAESKVLDLIDKEKADLRISQLELEKMRLEVQNLKDSMERMQLERQAAILRTNTLRFPNNIIKSSMRGIGKHVFDIDYSRFEIVDASIYSSLLPDHMDSCHAIFSKYLGSGTVLNTIVDGVAGVGCDTVFLSRIFPNASIMALESNR